MEAVFWSFWGGFDSRAPLIKGSFEGYQYYKGSFKGLEMLER